MQRTKWRTFGIASLVLATAVLVCDTADAGKRRRLKSWGSSGSSGSSSSHGSSGSSGGKHYSSHGSSGSSGSSSSHGSSGSSSSHGSSGSSGSSSSHGSSGSSGSSSSHGSSGSSGGWYSSHGSSGSSGSSSSHGSSGGVIISSTKPVTVKPASVQVEEKKEEAAPLPPPQTKLDVNKATLVVKVPEDATVFLVGRKMTSVGKERRFSIPIPDASKEYTYPVRVELVRNGKTLVSELKQKVRGGKEFALAVAESSTEDDVLALVAVR